MAAIDIPAITPPEIPAYTKGRIKQFSSQLASQKQHAKEAKPPVLQNRKKEEKQLENLSITSLNKL